MTGELNHAHKGGELTVCGIARTLGNVRVGAVTCADCLAVLNPPERPERPRLRGLMTPDEIGHARAASVSAYEDSAEEVGHPEGQPIVETFPELRELLASAATMAREVSPESYARVCDVVDRVKLDERSSDTDVYAGAILAALGLELVQ